MTQRVIDLRKPYTGDDSLPRKNGEEISSPIESRAHPSDASSKNPTPVNTANEIEWTCYEHDFPVRGPRWFLFPLGIEAVGTLYGIFIKSYLFVAFLVIAFIVLMVQMKRPPRLIAYAINKRGIFVGNRVYEFPQISSFWIFGHLPIPELSLETTQHISRFIHIRLDDIDADQVRNVLLAYIPEKEQKDLATDQIARIIGF